MSKRTATATKKKTHQERLLELGLIEQVVDVISSSEEEASQAEEEQEATIDNWITMLEDDGRLYIVKKGELLTLEEGLRDRYVILHGKV